MDRNDVDPWGGADGLPNAPDAAVAVIDARGIVTAWSPRARLLFGYAPAEVVGRPVADVLAADVSAALWRSLAQQVEWGGRVSLRHRDGHSLELGLRAQQLLSGDGEAQWVLMAVPLGEPPGREDGRTMVDWAFTQCPVVQTIYDTQLRIVRPNEAASRRYGMSEGELIGRRVEEILPGPVYAAFVRHLRQAVETGEPVHYEGYYRVPGVIHEHPWSHEMGPVKDAFGRVRGVIATTFESSEQYWGRQRWSLLNEAGTRIGTSLDVSQTARELTETIIPQLADFASVDLLDSAFQVNDPTSGPLYPPFALRRVAHHSIAEGCPEAAIAIGDVSAHSEHSPFARCLAAGRPVLTGAGSPDWNQWLAHDSLRKACIREFGFHSALAVPLRARGITLGVLFLLRRLHPEHPLDVNDAVLAEELAARAAVCIDNARRYTRERATALTLQRSLLPQRLAERTAVDFASRYLPAGSPVGVGGDWFDVISLSGARVALVVGDVVGHGIQASATMGRLRTAVRTLADVGLAPDELLTHLDDLVIRLSGESDMAERDGVGGDIGATCLYAVYDPISRRCTIARAGHPLPAVVLPDGTVDFPDLPAGPPLGLGGLPFESTELDLPEGSLLVLYTDGLIESRHRDIETGLDGLRHALAVPARSLETTCDTILGALLDERPEDDVALLIARTRALDAGQVATWDLPVDPAAVARTRAHATRQLAAWGLDDLAFTTELVVSELVTNAIRYGGPPIQLRLICDRALICEVSDGSSTAPHLRRARVFDEGGRGLLLVAQLTQRWGTRYTPMGKTIWAELDLTEA